MKLRNPLIALLVLVGLSAYVYFVEIQGGRRKQKEKEASERVYSFDTAQVTAVRLTQRGEPVRLEKAAGSWRILEPVAAEVDSDAVDRLLRALVELRISHDLGKPADLAAYNLAHPPSRVEIQVASPVSPPPLSLGDDPPTGGGTYARLGEQGKTLIVSGASSLQSATLFALRDKTFLRFDPGRLSTCRILRGKESIALSRVGGKWRLTSPVLSPADDAAVSDLVYALERLSVTEFLDDRPDSSLLAARGLDPPRTRVILSGEEWQGEKELAFGNSESGSLYALRPGSGSLVKVPDSVDAKLKNPLASLRKTDLLPFSRYEIERVRISGLAAAPLDLQRKSDTEWTRTSPSRGLLGDEPVDLLLRNLTDLKTESFLDRPGKNLARFGLGKPAVRLELWAKEPKGGPPAVLEVGRDDGKGKVAIKDAAWPAVMMVEAAVWKKASEQALKVAQEKVRPESAVAQTAPATSSPKTAAGKTAP